MSGNEDPEDGGGAGRSSVHAPLPSPLVFHPLHLSTTLSATVSLFLPSLSPLQQPLHTSETSAPEIKQHVTEAPAACHEAAICCMLTNIRRTLLAHRRYIHADIPWHSRYVNACIAYRSPSLPLSSAPPPLLPPFPSLLPLLPSSLPPPLSPPPISLAHPHPLLSNLPDSSSSSLTLTGPSPGARYCGQTADLPQPSPVLLRPHHPAVPCRYPQPPHSEHPRRLGVRGLGAGKGRTCARILGWAEGAKAGGGVKGAVEGGGKEGTGRGNYGRGGGVDGVSQAGRQIGEGGRELWRWGREPTRWRSTAYY